MFSVGRSNALVEWTKNINADVFVVLAEVVGLWGVGAADVVDGAVAWDDLGEVPVIFDESEEGWFEFDV
jgi:hypothetical protein